MNFLEKGELEGYTKAIIRKFAVEVNKSFGQNFIVNKSAIDDLISILELNDEDIVVEVGGGIGTLTYYLLKKCKKIFLYELDPFLSSILIKIFNEHQEKLEVISGDFLTAKVPVHQKLVSNLPYNISSPFIKKISEMENRPKTVAITLQKEFANHLCAKPGDPEYSRISVHSSFFYEFDIVKIFPPHFFIPSPKVYSSLVHGKRIEAPEPVKEKDFDFFLANLFCRKHKKVRNNLRIYSKTFSREQRKEFIKRIDKLEFKSHQPIKLTPNEILKLFQDFNLLLRDFKLNKVP